MVYAGLVFAVIGMLLGIYAVTRQHEPAAWVAIVFALFGVFMVVIIPALTEAQ